MKQLCRFWRRSASLLSVLCGAALLLAAVLYLNSGQSVRVELAQPTEPPATRTPEWEEIMRLLEDRENKPKPTPMPVPTPSPTPEITPLPEEVYEHMYSNVRGMDGKRLFDWEKVDYSVPPPGHSGREYDHYEDIWKADFTGRGRYIVYKGFVFCSDVNPEKELPDEYWGLTSKSYHLSWWLKYIDEHGDDIRTEFSNNEPAKGEDLYDWIRTRYKRNDLYFLWGDWIVCIFYPPPGYSGEESYTYERQWIEFFEKNPEMLHINWPSPFAG